jgi:hypothetical protein
MFHVNGHKYKELTGSRAQVWNKSAHHTEGGLTRKNLIRNKHGRIVSAKKHRTAKRERRLEKAGFFTVKGKFGAVKKDKKRGSRKMKKGGSGDIKYGGEDPPVENVTTETPKVEVDGETQGGSALSPAQYNKV